MREIRNTVKQLNSSLGRLQLLEKNVTLALDRIRLNAAYQSHLDAYIRYKLLLADVMRKTFYDFETGQPIVQDYEY